MKKFYLKYMSLVILICFVTYLSCLPNQIASTISQPKHSSIVIYVKDKHTKEPIGNATVCIINTKEYYSTDKYGYTETIRLPLFDIFKSDEFYLFNLLIYKKGYNDFLYFNLKAKQNQKRTDIVIELTQIINDADNTPTLLFEEPLNITIEKIIKENKR